MTPEIEQIKWGSHLPALLACIGSTVGPVLEVGVGYCSTPHLHALCGAMGRPLTSVEQNREWFEWFAALYQDNHHKFIAGEYNVVIPSLALQQWSVALIDNSPGGERRRDDFASLIKCCGFVVVHDYERENEEAIGPLLGPCDFYVCTRYDPPTLVASLTRTIPKSIIEHEG